jgi:hypothetical protein
VHLLSARDEKDPVKRAQIVEKTIAYMNEPFFTTYSTIDQAKGGPLMRYGQIQHSCRICNVNLDKFTVTGNRPGKKVLCDIHSNQHGSLLQDYKGKVCTAQARSDATWKTCADCVGEKGNAKECPNLDCSIYWKRIKYDNDLEHLSKYMQRIDLSW